MYIRSQLLKIDENALVKKKEVHNDADGSNNRVQPPRSYVNKAANPPFRSGYELSASAPLLKAKEFSKYWDAGVPLPPCASQSLVDVASVSHVGTGIRLVSSPSSRPTTAKRDTTAVGASGRRPTTATCLRSENTIRQIEDAIQWEREKHSFIEERLRLSAGIAPLQFRFSEQFPDYDSKTRPSTNDLEAEYLQKASKFWSSQKPAVCFD